MKTTGIDLKAILLDEHEFFMVKKSIVANETMLLNIYLKKN
jgi:hypothetical protein